MINVYIIQNRSFNIKIFTEENLTIKKDDGTEEKLDDLEIEITVNEISDEVELLDREDNKENENIDSEIEVDNVEDLVDNYTIVDGEIVYEGDTDDKDEDGSEENGETKADEVEEKKEEENKNKAVETSKEQNEQKKENKDETVANKKIPQTGIAVSGIICILIIAMIFVSIILYKKSKI